MSHSVQQRGMIQLIICAQNIIIIRLPHPAPMSSSEEQLNWKDEDQEYQYGIFNNLLPVLEEKVKAKKGTFSWIANATTQNKKNNKKANKKALKKEEQRRSRSRSRQRQIKKFRPTPLIAKEQERSSDHMIVISDDEQSQRNGDYFKSQFLSLNWRQRRKLNRLFEREQRNYRFGKQKDSLSFTIFNTIESYFR